MKKTLSKKLFAIILSSLLVLSLVSCTKKPNNTDTANTNSSETGKSDSSKNEKSNTAKEENSSDDAKLASADATSNSASDKTEAKGNDENKQKSTPANKAIMHSPSGVIQTANHPENQGGDATGEAQQPGVEEEPNQPESNNSENPTPQANPDDNQSKPNIPSTDTDEGYPDTSKLRCAPYATVDFIQPGWVQYWTDSMWENHLNSLKDVGIEQVIIQATHTHDVDDYGEYETKIFPDGDDNSGSYCLERLLSNAEKLGIKVWIGSNSDSDWWQSKSDSENWMDAQNDINLANMQKCYNLYKSKYPNAFYGWYFSWEMWNSPWKEQKFEYMFNRYIKDMNSVDSSMPILFSPFLSEAEGSTPEQTGEMYTKFFNNVNFRDGDVFCPQFSYGGSNRTMTLVCNYTKELYKAVHTNPKLKFWINVESFTSDGGCMSLTTYTYSLNNAARFVDRIASFSITHYQDNYRWFGDEPYNQLKKYVEETKRKYTA